MSFLLPFEILVRVDFFHCATSLPSAKGPCSTGCRMLVCGKVWLWIGSNRCLSGIFCSFGTRCFFASLKGVFPVAAACDMSPAAPSLCINKSMFDFCRVFPWESLIFWPAEFRLLADSLEWWRPSRMVCIRSQARNVKQDVSTGGGRKKSPAISRWLTVVTKPLYFRFWGII